MKILFTVILMLLSTVFTKTYSQDSITLGAYIEFTHNPSLKGKVENSPLQYPDKHAALHDYRNWRHGYCDTCVTYEDWVATSLACTSCDAPGDALVTKWINEDILTAEDSVYLQIAKASYMWPSYHNGTYDDKTVPKGASDRFTWYVYYFGRNALKKGYRHETLSSKDSINIALYRLFIESRETTAPRLPHQLGISRDKYKPFLPGEAAPDFRAFKLDTLLNSPKYADGEAGRADLFAFLSDNADDEFYNLFKGYEADGTSNAKEIIKTNGTDSNFYHLSNNIGDKPLVLILASSRDVFWPRCYAMTEALVQAYSDKVDFLFVDVEIHDVHMSPPEYFGIDAGKTTTTTWSITAEQRARISKIRAMEAPYSSMPICVDDQYETIRNKYFSEGGDGFYIILDKSGKVAYQMAAGWAQYGPWHSDYTDDVLWSNQVEKYIVKLINNNGLYDPNATYPWPSAENKSSINNRVDDRKDRWGDGYWPIMAYDKLWEMANIVDIDTVNHKITFLQYDYSKYEDKMIGYQFTKDAGATATLTNHALNYKNKLGGWLTNTDSLSRLFTFKIDNGVELFLNGEEVLNETSFKIGDFVNVKYDFDDLSQEYPIQVRTSRYNFAPTINDIGDVSVTENSSEQIISLSGLTDGNTANDQHLSFTIHSSNTELIPTLSVSNVGLDTAQLKFTPVGSKTGTSFISIKIKDDGGADFGGVDSMEIYFQINVLPMGGHMPTINDIKDLNILEDDGEHSVLITGVSDGDDGDDLMPLTVISSDTALIPSSAITYNSTTSTANITFTTGINKSGTANMLVIVEDTDGLKVKKHFAINVTAINDQPTINPIDDIIIDQDLGLQYIQLLGIYDGENFTQKLSISASSDNPDLISSYNIKYTQDSSFALFNYRSNVGKSGVANITITVKDNGNTENGGVNQIKETFAITVNSTTSVNLANEESILMYPNPATDIVYFNNLNNISSIAIQNSLGQIVIKQSDVSSTSYEINLGTLENGVYLVKITQNNGYIYILKLFKH